MAKTTITEALAQLDHTNDEHWTADGQPRIDVVKAIVGHTVTRQEIVDAAPDFSRAVAEAAAQAEAGDEDADQLTDGEGDEVDGEDGGDELATDDDALGEDEDDGEEPAGDEPDAAEGDPTTNADPGDEAIEFPEGAVLRMPLERVLRSKELTERAFREVEAALGREAVIKRACDARIERLNSFAEILTRYMQRQDRDDHGSGTQKNIAAYLDRANESRARRMNAAHRFIRGGTTERDVAEATRVAAPVDAARNMRRPVRPLMAPASPPAGR